MIADINNPKHMALYASKMNNSKMLTDRKMMFLYDENKKLIAKCSRDEFYAYMKQEGHTMFKVTEKMSRFAKGLLGFGIAMCVVLVVAVVIICTGGIAAIAAGAFGLVAVKGFIGSMGSLITCSVGIAAIDKVEVHVRRI